MAKALKASQIRPMVKGLADQLDQTIRRCGVNEDRRLDMLAAYQDGAMSMLRTLAASGHLDVEEE
jgi:hypothetical protein